MTFSCDPSRSPQADFEETVFRHKIDDALKAVERILEVHRNPRLAEDVDHEYGDKYRLVDQLTNTALIAQLNALVHFGVTEEVLKSIDKTKPVTLRFQASDSCAFLKEHTVEVPMQKTEEKDEHIQTNSPFFGSTTKSTIKQVVHHVREFHWKVQVQWEISIYSGTDVAERKVLSNRSSSMVLMTQSDKRAPLPEHRECKPVDLSLTWLLSQIDTGAMTSTFRVDTQHPETKTPRRNQQVEEAIKFMRGLQWWMGGVRAYFDRCVQQDIIDRHNPAGPVPVLNPNDRLSVLSCDNMFIPVLALMEEKGGDDGAKDPVLSTDDMDKFLKEQTRTIHERLEKLQQTYPGRQLNKIVSVAEATIVLLSLHSAKMSFQFVDCVDYVEAMLSGQLVAAIGKRVQHSDIDKFMRYHNARLLDPAPQPFCHAIRQPGHDPCGLMSIEGAGSSFGDGKKEPIETLMREVHSAGPMMLSVDAATTVELTGKKYLHGWVQQRFGSDGRSYELIVRARQFSSFLLVVGTMAGPDRLDPKDAIIVQNKDELFIPLLLEEIPTAKEFKDAIRSLSPEQQRFAGSFRSMQLGSSVMGICVVQIKPQLETLLGLPRDALTKEMKLTQDLIELFVEYQVPSDLLSYDGIQDNISPNEKVDNVKGHVKAVLDVISEAKKKQLEEQKMKATMAFETAVEEIPARSMFVGGIFDRPGDVRSIPRDGKPSGEDKHCEWKRNEDYPPGVLRDEDEIFDRPGGMLNGRPTPRDGKPIEDEPYGWESYPRDEPFDRPGDVRSIPRNGKPMQDFDRPGDGDKLFDRPGDLRSIPRNGKPMQDAPPSPVDGSADSQVLPSGSGQDAPALTVSKAQDLASASVPTASDGSVNFTALPRLLNSSIEEHASGAVLRSTNLKLADTWSRSRQENLLIKASRSSIGTDLIKTERNKAFDLLDALSKSGSLPIAFSELHVIVSVTHCFEKDMIRTIVEDNVNPIEKLEMSTLLVGSAIHGVAASLLVRDKSELMRLHGSFPKLLASDQLEE